MKETIAALHGVTEPVDRWIAEDAAGLDDLGALTYRSNLLGADRSLANIGGGNTSAKGVVLDHAGRETRVLWVKGSGTDLATITPSGFAALRLGDVLPLREREAMDDATMVDYLLRSALRPDQPRPSIETLLHAFVPAAQVDHTHPDAVIALTSTPRGGGSRPRSSATRWSGSTTSGPASTCRAGSPSSSMRARRRERCCSRSTGS